MPISNLNPSDRDSIDGLPIEQWLHKRQRETGARVVICISLYEQVQIVSAGQVEYWEIIHLLRHLGRLHGKGP